jgi:hypothetical protein
MHTIADRVTASGEPAAVPVVSLLDGGDVTGHNVVGSFLGPVMCEVADEPSGNATVMFTVVTSGDVLPAAADYLADHRFAVAGQLVWRDITPADADAPGYRLQLTVDLDDVRARQTRPR